MALTYGDLFGEIPEPLLVDGDTPREDDFVFFNPFVKEWIYRIHLPQGMEPRQLPEDRTVKIGGMRYEETFTLEQEGLLIIHLRLDSGLRRLDGELFEATRRGLKKLGGSDVTVLKFDHVGAVHLAAGRSRQAIDAYRRLVESHPDEPIHRVRYAQALLSLGMGQEARRQARLASQGVDAPAVAHWMLGSILTHDEVGRIHLPGFDHAGALTALRQAQELDPNNALFHAELAILLDFDLEGIRYSTQADLDAAIEQYRLWRQRFTSPALDENLLNSLFRRQRWQELHDLAQELETDDTTYQVWRLTALGALEGADPVLVTARRLGKDRDAQAQLLDAVAKNLILTGHFSAASQILRQTAASSDNTAAAIERARVLSEIRPLGQPNTEVADPAGLIRQFFVQMLTDTPDTEALAALFHPRTIAREEIDDASLRDLHAQVRRAISQASGHLPARPLLQLVLSILEFEIEGDDATGYRVEVASKLPDFGYQATAHVQTWEDVYRLIALEGEPTLLAEEALAKLDAGEPGAAHQWLTWARDLLPTQNHEDPLGGDVFARFWGDGEGTDVDVLRLAAHFLLVQDPKGNDASAAYLRHVLEATEDGRLQRNLYLGLAAAALVGERWQELEEHCRWLHEAEPASQLALESWIHALEVNAREDALSALVSRLQAMDPNDPTALRILANQYLRRGDLAQAFEVFSTLDEGAQDRGGDDPKHVNDLNLWAWAKLFESPVSSRALDLAQKSAGLNGYRSYAILHTLAMAYAELEHPFEAYRVLLQAIEVRGTPTLEDSDHLVMGRIAQSYGLDDRALEFYGRIEAPTHTHDPLSSWHLAQRHLAELGAAEGPRKRRKRRS